MTATRSGNGGRGWSPRKRVGGTHAEGFLRASFTRSSDTIKLPYIWGQLQVKVGASNIAFTDMYNDAGNEHGSAYAHASHLFSK